MSGMGPGSGNGSRSGRSSSSGSARCVGEPVSWLRLERFHLGEVGGPERERIAEHLAACPTCAACLAHLEEDDARSLPPLSSSRPVRRGLRSPFLVRASAAVGALAAVAVTLVVVGTRSGKAPGDVARITVGHPRVKGDAFAFSLVRDDEERLVGTEGVYRDGDRFEAIVTCPPGPSLDFDVVVYDTGGASFPIEPVRALPCGNEVPIPGAFRLTGEGDETVCLVWSEGAPVDRGRLASQVTALSSCKRLKPAPKP